MDRRIFPDRARAGRAASNPSVPLALLLICKDHSLHRTADALLGWAYADAPPRGEGTGPQATPTR